MTTTPKPARMKARTDITYWHDGRPMPGNHRHKLSTLAYFHSGNIDTKKPQRLATKDFAKLLVTLGVTDPGAPGWIVKLPNGVTIECRNDGDKSQFNGAPVKAKNATARPAAKKPTKVTKKAPAKKASTPKKTAKKATAKKAPAAKSASRQVTPRFKTGRAN